MSDWLNEVIGEDLIAEYEVIIVRRTLSFGCGKNLGQSASCGPRKSTGCGGWLQIPITEIYLKSCHRILIPMSACG